ncbi:MAG: hypothetical protein ACM3PU_04085 [Gemmatimonadota bacterium]
MNRRSVLVRVASCAALALGVAAASGARADCRPVLDALEKMAAQARTASYEVEDDKSAPTADSDYTIRIGKRSWQSISGRTFEGKQADSALAAEIRQRQTGLMNKLGCESLGTGSYRGAAVMRYRYPNLMAQGPLSAGYLKQRGLTEKQVRTFLVYVDQKSGLPVYSETYNVTGVKLAQAMVYGDAVKEPAGASGKGKK